MDTGDRAGQLILIVEDDALFRKSLTTFIGALGYQTAQSASAEEALRSQELARADLCIVDYHLPGMSGVDFLNSLRGHGIRVPVLLMSGYLNGGIRADAVREGALDVLHKPMDMALLVQRLERALGSPATA